MRLQTSVSVEKKGVRLDEVHFLRSWLEKPLATGAVMPSGKVLARTMARYVDPEIAGRYGTGVYVRCAPSPAVAKKK